MTSLTLQWRIKHCTYYQINKKIHNIYLKINLFNIQIQINNNIAHKIVYMIVKPFNTKTGEKKLFEKKSFCYLKKCIRHVIALAKLLLLVYTNIVKLM